MVCISTLGPAPQGGSRVSTIALFPESSNKDCIVLVQEGGGHWSLLQIWHVRTKKCVRENSFKRTQDNYGACNKHYAIDIICLGS